MNTTFLKTAVPLIVILAAAIFSPMDAQVPKKQPAEQRIILVAGNDPWTETDIVIGPSDKVTFKATGKVCFHGKSTQSCMDPAGWSRQDYINSWADEYNMCDDPMPDANHASLIGDIGGQAFYIGTGKTITGKEGVLKLGINDCTFDDPTFGNNGSFSVVISIVRGKS